MDNQIHLASLIEAIRNQVDRYLWGSLKVEINSSDVKIASLDVIHLKEFTSFITFNGYSDSIVAFSFDRATCREIMQIETAGLDIAAADEEVYMEAAIAEMANIIMGYVCKELEQKGKLLGISPPVVLVQEPRGLFPIDSMTFSQIRVQTPIGDFDINCIDSSVPLHFGVHHYLNRMVKEEEGALPLNILVIDDSVLTIKVLQAHIKALGHKVIYAEQNGANALNAYRSVRPDLVTMDIVMPGLDGISATKQILAEFPDAAIIMITSQGQELIQHEALKAGARGFVSKPISLDALSDAIKQAKQHTKIS